MYTRGVVENEWSTHGKDSIAKVLNYKDSIKFFKKYREIFLKSIGTYLKTC